MLVLNLKAAKEELATKDIHEIQIETVQKWAARAHVAYSSYIATDEVKWFLDGNEYEHEAREHAALAEKRVPELLKFLEAQLGPVSAQAHKKIGGNE